MMRTDLAMIIFCIAMFGAALFGMTNKARAHDWYPPKCCGEHDCAVVQAWPIEEGQWQFRYTDGQVYDVPDSVIQPDETNKDPFQAHACVIPESSDEMGDKVAPYVRCFWRKAAGS